jgi:hypothetical protein
MKGSKQAASECAPKSIEVKKIATTSSPKRRVKGEGVVVV